MNRRTDARLSSRTITLRTCILLRPTQQLQTGISSIVEQLDAASVPAGRIYTVVDIAADPHYRARNMILQTKMADGSTLALPGIVPKLSRTPGSHRRNAPEIGQDTDTVLQDIGLTPAQIKALKDKGIVQ